VNLLALCHTRTTARHDSHRVRTESSRMAHVPTPAERRDDLADDRDTTAEDRDTTSTRRDVDAVHRDVDAAHRDTRAHQHTDDLDNRVEQLRRQLLDHFTRAENTTIDPADWPDLTPAALDRLRAHAAEQRRLAALDRAAATRLLADLHAQIHGDRPDRHAAAGDRRAAAQDRSASAQGRHSAAQDRDDAARDRDQAAIEREQTDSPGLSEPDQEPTRADESLAGRAAQVVDESRRRIAASRAYLTRSRPTQASLPPATGPDHDPGRD
jgi:hypothetical protein